MNLVLWRVWLTHYNITHQSGLTGILDGVHALLSMKSSLDQIEGTEGAFFGKATVGYEHPDRGKRYEKERIDVQVKTGWEPPSASWCKINVDGSFVMDSGEAGVGVLARDSGGGVIFTAWRVLSRCSDVAEVEVMC